MTKDELDSLNKALDHLDGGNLEGAHRIAQALEGYPAADTVHAIVHRRDGDYSNSGYWWRRVGGNLPDELRDLYGDPIRFVERCRVAMPGTPEADAITDAERKEVEILRLVVFGSQTK